MPMTMNADRVSYRIGPAWARSPLRWVGGVTVGIWLVLMSALIAAEAQPASGAVVIHEAFPSKNAAFWPNFVTDALGLYAKEGIEVQPVIVDPNVTVSALLGGSVEISYADSTQLLLALEKGANLVAVGLSTDRQPYKLMAAPGIKTIADLKGKKIGAASAIDIYTYVLKQILRKANLDPDKDVDWVIGGGQNQRLAAAIGGAVQAGLFSPPSDAKLTGLGFTTLAFTPDSYPNLTLSAETVRRDWAQQNGDVLRHLLAAEAAGIKWINDPANKAKAIAILVQAVKATPADAEDSYEAYIGKVSWTDACIHRPGMVNVVKIMHETQQLKTITEADVPKFADPEWCSK